MQPDENQLVDSARRGDHAAAVRLIELFYERIYAFLRRLAGNDADAADLTQRTFSRVWQALPTFAGRSTVACWLHGIAHHVYVDWRRTNHRSEPRSDEWWASRPAVGLRPDESAVQTDLAASVYAAVDRLEPDQREAVYLHYYQGLTLEETAGAQGVAASTVKYRLRLALAELQKKFSSEQPSLNPRIASQTI